MLPVGTKSGRNESVDGSVVAEQIDIKASTDALQELNRSSDMWPCTLSSKVLHRLSKTNAPLKSCGDRSNRCAATRDSRISARTSLTRVAHVKNCITKQQQQCMNYQIGTCNLHNQATTEKLDNNNW